MLGVVIAMSLLGSLLFSAVSANVTISFVVVAFILMLGRHLDKVALQVGEPAVAVCWKRCSSSCRIWSFSMFAILSYTTGRQSTGWFVSKPRLMVLLMEHFF